ncbi:Gfo/Idh/MocA family oxidoreductase [Nocardiopsis sp. HNM0947]|uniref:Glycosyl hydrolase family 109 protein n=1 Tax=Nocardiopsis coralli TaxID=2772213 RepID=A0ABR9P9Y8_9ACTN|nr:Gfo/Idh/MocA family oxidoreductase [Nocardiopsis coralli]MBE3000656.1 Gfo/Idh/MocA family oxidoreductase [Nocardiopsis coralli]
MIRPPTRRDLFRSGAAAGAATGLGTVLARPASADDAPQRGGDESPMTEVPFEPHDEVRLAVIGTGQRGADMLDRFLQINGVRVTALCDLEQDRADAAADAVEEAGGERPAVHAGSTDAWEELTARDDVDLCYIATPWEWHHPQAKDAMEHGMHAAVELPIAVTLDDIWDLVRTSERTRKHCMLMENVNYGQEEMRVLMMAKEGLFGDLLHGSGGYVHDLRDPFLFHGAYHPEDWRRAWQTKMNASHYPMHGLAPITAAMDINRGDRLDRLVSFSSPALSLTEYRAENLDSDHPAWQDDYISGDRNVCLLSTAAGRMIRVDHDVNTPHPQTRANTLGGTRGVWMSDPQRIYLESLDHDDHEWRDFDEAYEKYDHWLWKEIGDEGGGHGGMDYILQWRTIQLMRLGLTPDIDVYDSASLSSLVPLSESSLESGGSVPVPDFTRGHWKNARPGLERERPDDPELD